MFVKLENIRFQYAEDLEKLTLSDISFDVNKGNVVAIVGSSGSGKSTLLRTIAGILPNKRDRLFGKINIDNVSPVDYLKKGKISFMFQHPAIFPNLTVRENINLPFRIRNQKNDEKIEKLIKTVGLKGFEDYLPRRLSGGMKTRVSLARSFAIDPELLLLDEPFSSLDVAWKDVLYFELKQLISASRTTVVLVTHDIREAIELSDTIICLSVEGNILLKQKNTKNQSLYSEIENIIIKDHKLRNEKRI